MCKNVAIFYTDRFSTEIAENPDSEPPPGRDFAQSLLTYMIAEGAVSKDDAIPDDYWEHNEWFQFIEWQTRSFTISIELSFADTVPPKWYVVVSENIGGLKSVFASLSGNREKFYNIPDCLKQAIERYLVTVSQGGVVQWVTMSTFEEMLTTD